MLNTKEAPQHNVEQCRRWVRPGRKPMGRNKKPPAHLKNGTVKVYNSSPPPRPQLGPLGWGCRNGVVCPVQLPVRALPALIAPPQCTQSCFDHLRLALHPSLYSSHSICTPPPHYPSACIYRMTASPTLRSLLFVFFSCNFSHK
uniref:Uncharacterized protein n=1 Tax=Trypanosoma congolense (strain IL3000) TaxID=1068625 RepID=G0UT22_TRYCI|nr:hypothetical protein, unlikely [Trypanosoma congolense IL3000]